MKIPIETSARHVHLSEKDFKKLFGKGKKLIPLKKLSQPGQFATKEKIDLIKGKNKISNVRVVGPLREKSQIEISKTDAIKLGINAPIRLSGNTKGAPKILAQNKNKKIKIPVIIAKRHLHCSIEQAKKLKLKNNKKVSVKVQGQRGLIFNKIIVRSGKGHKLALHLDTDETNAAGISGKVFGEIVK